MRLNGILFCVAAMQSSSAGACPFDVKNNQSMSSYRYSLIAAMSSDKPYGVHARGFAQQVQNYHSRNMPWHLGAAAKT